MSRTHLRRSSPYAFALVAILITPVVASLDASADELPVVAVRVAAGGQHTLLVKPDGTVWAFGNNSSGQLGTANYVQYRVP